MARTRVVWPELGLVAPGVWRDPGRRCSRHPSQRKIIRPNAPGFGSLAGEAAVLFATACVPRKRVAIEHVAIVQHAERDGLDLEVEQPSISRDIRIRHDGHGKADASRLRIQLRESFLWIHLARKFRLGHGLLSRVLIGRGEAGAEKEHEREGEYARASHVVIRSRRLAGAPRLLAQEVRAGTLRHPDLRSAYPVNGPQLCSAAVRAVAARA